ncbi:MAG: ATP-binding protein, partial [Bacteroidales bacterium]|nr:ATP-binding protein [Bacteroidales bacterium]
MKKFYTTSIVATVIILCFSALFFRYMHISHITYQKDQQFSLLKLAVNEIEQDIHHFESDLNFLAFGEKLSGVIENEITENDLRKIELFYSSYSTLIEEIELFDKNKNVINIYLDEKNHFITGRYQAQRQHPLKETQVVKKYNSKYQYYIPVIKDSTVFANIMVTINFDQYLTNQLAKFFTSVSHWKWIVKLEPGKIINVSNKKVTKINKEDEILRLLREDHTDIKIHTIVSDSTKHKVLTVFSPCNVLQNNYAIASSTSLNNSFNKLNFFTISLVVSIVVILVGIIIYLLSHLRFRTKKLLFYKSDWEAYQKIFEDLPIGLIISDHQNKILNINAAARELLLIKSKSEISTSDISNRLLSQRSRISSNKAYDQNQYILYEKKGNEVVIYKNDVTCIINGKEITISALMDITTIEKARKFEAAANTAKSEFLAKMSHEIRTPMNGIIGMTEALQKKELNEEQAEYVEIVKRSADLLLNLIDDILDYSKIEAGKMQIEEVPYSLPEEIKLSLDLFKAIINEKGLLLKVNIHNDVPEKIIGDPFRLRQVLSNLFSNAIKFTHEGIIEIEVQLEEEYSGNITLLFSVADTGVGIPKEKLESIFNSFTQAEQSTSRKYGGSGLGTTICKQLVTLMNGEIWVESPSGISNNKKYPGTRFSFTIEVYSNEEIHKSIDTSSIKSFADMKTLFVSINSNKKTRLLGFFKHYNIPVTVVNVQENIAPEVYAALKKDDYKLIVLADEPGFDAIELAGKLNAKDIADKYRVIIISNNHKSHNYILSKHEKVDHYIEQPFEHKHLKSCLKESFPHIEIDETSSLNLPKDIRILVAEDNIINQKVAETIFLSLGYQIDIAYDGNQVI